MLKDADSPIKTKSRKLLEILNGAGWYIIKDETVGAGPYETEKKASLESRHLRWYNRHEYDIVYGYVDEEDKFHELDYNKVKSDAGDSI